MHCQPWPCAPFCRLRCAAVAAAAAVRCRRARSTHGHASWPRLQSPFGDAKPREVVIAQKVGKTEEEVLKEEVSKEKLHVSWVLRRVPANPSTPLLLPSQGRLLCGQGWGWEAKVVSDSNSVAAAAAVLTHCPREALRASGLTPTVPLLYPLHPQLRLSGAQLEEKRQAEADIEETREALSLEEDQGKRTALEVGCPPAAWASLTALCAGAMGAAGLPSASHARDGFAGRQ